MARFTVRVARMAFLAALFIGCAWTARAQTNSADPDFARMRDKLKVGDQVTVSLLDGTSVKGKFAELSTDALAVSTASGERRVSAGDISKVQRHRRGMWLGAVIGGGVGLACGAALGALSENEGGSQMGPVVGLTALGAGIGLGIDALINFPRTVYKQPSNRVAMRIDATPKRAAVGITLAF